MLCCGEERSTPFCPQCGRRTTCPKAMVLGLVRWHLARANERVGRLESDRNVGGEEMAQAQKAAAEWQACLDWLESIPEGAGRQDNLGK